MMDPMLEVKGLSVGYARKGLALEDVSLSVPKGSIVALLGANGAGKTTLIRAVSGLLSLHHGHIEQGSVTLAGQPILGQPPHRLVRLGMTQVPEGRLIFKQLSVEDNLNVGAAILPRSEVKDRMQAVFDLFPRLLERRTQAAGWLSGGEQQMLALGRALVSGPKSAGGRTLAGAGAADRAGHLQAAAGRGAAAWNLHADRGTERAAGA